MEPMCGWVMVGTLASTILAGNRALELSHSSRLGAQCLHEPELASSQGTGTGKVITLLQSRSCELCGKNVNEDTILNVESRRLCELAL